MVTANLIQRQVSPTHKYSGKTYTMGSAPSSKGESGGFEAEGIIPRAVRHIFDLIVSEHATKIVNVKVQFVLRLSSVA